MISIFGTGIAGLTCALELVEKGYTIVMYEKDNLPGGMAKSKRINGTTILKSSFNTETQVKQEFNGVPSEHSWRGYATFYFNVFNLLKRIPIETENFSSDNIVTYKNNTYDITDYIKKHPGGSIIKKALGRDLEDVWKEYNVSWHMKNSNVLKRLEQFKINIEKFENKTAYDNLFPNLNFLLFYNKKSKEKKKIIHTELISLYYHFIIFSLGNERAHKYYEIKLLDFINKKNISKYTYDYIMNFVLGPGLGLDKNNCSLGTFFHYFHLALGSNTSITKKWYVMKKPTSEGFIDPLVNLLLKKGVKIIYNCELLKINQNDNKIISCLVKINNEIKNIISDDYVIAINPNNCYEIFNNSNMNKLAEIHNNLQITNKQISFRIGFIKKINFSISNTGIALLDSKYDITFYPQENFFNVPIDYNNQLKSLWSGTCLQINENISLDEIKKNIIEQILNCEELQNNIYENSGFKLNENDLIYFEIYDDWYWQDDELLTKNKKWVNTFFNENYKPSQKTEFENLYLSGGHTNTSIKIWSMEAACESGKLTANYILKKYNKEKGEIYIHKKPNYFKIFEKIDDLLLKNNLPSVLFFIIVLLLYIIYKALK